jgi:WD40 repeat protein
VGTGAERLRIHGHQRIVWTVAFSPDGKLLASGGGELNSPDEVKVWDADTGKHLFSFAQAKGIHHLAFHPDGRNLAGVVTYSDTLKVWDLAERRERFAVQAAPRPRRVTYDADGRRLFTGSFPDVEVWDAATGQRLKVLRGHTSDVGGIACSPDGRRLATCGYDQTVKLWDLETGQEVLSLDAHSDGIWGVLFTPNGRRLISCSDDQTVKIWDATPR